MKTKLISILLMSVLAFNQSACGNSQESNSENRVTIDT